jgi:hypothetical protein
MTTCLRIVLNGGIEYVLSDDIDTSLVSDAFVKEIVCSPIRTAASF